MSVFSANVSGSILVQVYFLFADDHLLQLQHILSAAPAAPIRTVANPGLLFSMCGQSKFLRCYNVALFEFLSVHW